VETLEDDALPVGETVSNIGEVVTRVTGRHIRFTPRLHAKETEPIFFWQIVYILFIGSYF
jgi:hypothetical protein